MDLRVLEYFLAVADEENISHAAELLHVSQPTISRQLMDLEEELDRKLFIRTNKKVILTEEGMLFRETAEDILKLYNRARADHTRQNELEGEIYIACGEIESFDLVAGKIRDFHLLRPFHPYFLNRYMRICSYYRLTNRSLITGGLISLQSPKSSTEYGFPGILCQNFTGSVLIPGKDTAPITR